MIRSPVLDCESELSMDPDRARPPALAIAGCEALTGRELKGCAQDRFRWVVASLPLRVGWRASTGSLRWMWVDGVNRQVLAPPG
jgi:hypothetical protein